MKTWMTLTLFLAALALAAGPAFSEKPPAATEEHFSTRGSVTHVDAAAKVVYVKTEGGLELTFHAVQTTQITAGEKFQALSDLRPEDEVEIVYDYNPNYEKLARTITKKPSPATSPGKNPPPST